MAEQLTRARPFFPTPGKTPLFSVNPGVSTFDALDNALIYMSTLRQALCEVACQLESSEDPPDSSQIWALTYIAETVEAVIFAAMPEQRP